MEFHAIAALRTSHTFYCIVLSEIIRFRIDIRIFSQSTIAIFCVVVVVVHIQSGNHLIRSTLFVQIILIVQLFSARIVYLSFDEYPKTQVLTAQLMFSLLASNECTRCQCALNSFIFAYVRVANKSTSFNGFFLWLTEARIR